MVGACYNIILYDNGNNIMIAIKQLVAGSQTTLTESFAPGSYSAVPRTDKLEGVHTALHHTARQG